MRAGFVTLAILCSTIPQLSGQETVPRDGISVPISTAVLLGGVKDAGSKGVIKSVLMIQCPKDEIKGSGFAMNKGRVIITNSHVLGTCTPAELVGISPVVERPIRFLSFERDNTRDVAALCPVEQLAFSMKLDVDKNARIDSEVETWGYPLSYADRAPILSRGYIAGYRTEVIPANSTPALLVKHLIVNGAFNPGNSGGPLILRKSGKVIGVVVAKWTLWSPNVENAILGFSRPRLKIRSGFTWTDPQTGEQVPVSDEEVIAEVLQEFYSASQVMIGEAVSISELQQFINERRTRLSCWR